MAPASRLNFGVHVLAAHKKGEDTLWVSYLSPPFIFWQVWKHVSAFEEIGRAMFSSKCGLPGGKKEMAVSKEQNC